MRIPCVDFQVDEPIIFEQEGDFKALSAARAWCTKNGFGYGSLAHDMPVGLLRGDWCIAKWRNLTQAEINGLDGCMQSLDFRNGPVRIFIKTQDGEVQP